LALPIVSPKAAGPASTIEGAPSSCALDVLIGSLPRGGIFTGSSLAPTLELSRHTADTFGPERVDCSAPDCAPVPYATHSAAPYRRQFRWFLRTRVSECTPDYTHPGSCRSRLSRCRPSIMATCTARDSVCGSLSIAVYWYPAGGSPIPRRAPAPHLLDRRNGNEPGRPQRLSVPGGKERAGLSLRKTGERARGTEATTTSGGPP